MLKIKIIMLFLLGIFSCSPMYYSHLQNANISCPLPHANIPVIEKARSEVIVLRPSFAINPERSIETRAYGHTKVNADGIYEVEYHSDTDSYSEWEGVNIYDFKKNNLTWELPFYQLGLDIDLIPERLFLFTGGINYTRLNHQELLGAKIGAGLHGFHENFAYRIDAFLNVVQYYSKAEFVIVDDYFSGDTREVQFLNYSNKKYQQSPCLSLTLNTQYPDRWLNYYLYASLGEYNVYNFDTGTDLFYQEDIEHLQYDYRVNYSTLSIGAFKDYASYARIVVGIKLHLMSDDTYLHKVPQIYIQNDIILR